MKFSLEKNPVCFEKNPVFLEKNPVSIHSRRMMLRQNTRGSFRASSESRNQERGLLVACKRPQRKQGGPDGAVSNGGRGRRFARRARRAADASHVSELALPVRLSVSQ